MPIFLEVSENILITISFSLAAHSAVVLKAESATEKTEWIKKISNVIQAKGGQIKILSEGGSSMRHSLSDGSLVSCWLNTTVLA